jgi:hypothetical protein
MTNWLTSRLVANGLTAGALRATSAGEGPMSDNGTAVEDNAAFSLGARDAAG